jgi:Pentapeptide repeats (9 copies)
MGYCLPDVSFQSKQLTEALYFNEATFYEEANFLGATFSNEADLSSATFSDLAYFRAATFSNKADFSGSTFLSEAYFSGEFNGPTYFHYTIFEQPTKVTFNISNMSNVSFSDSDITKIRFSDKVTWGGNDGYTIIEEEMLKNFLKYLFDWENITAPNSKDSDRLKDFLRQRGVNWKGDLQFTKQFTKIDGIDMIFETILVKSTLNSLPVDDESIGATQQIDNKGSYFFEKKIGQIKLSINNEAILIIDGNDKDE